MWKCIEEDHYIIRHTKGGFTLAKCACAVDIVLRLCKVCFIPTRKVLKKFIAIGQRIRKWDVTTQRIDAFTHPVYACVYCIMLRFPSSKLTLVH